MSQFGLVGLVGFGNKVPNNNIICIYLSFIFGSEKKNV